MIAEPNDCNVGSFTDRTRLGEQRWICLRLLTMERWWWVQKGLPQEKHKETAWLSQIQHRGSLMRGGNGNWIEVTQTQRNWAHWKIINVQEMQKARRWKRTEWKSPQQGAWQIESIMKCNGCVVKLRLVSRVICRVLEISLLVKRQKATKLYKTIKTIKFWRKKSFQFYTAWL